MAKCFENDEQLRGEGVKELPTFERCLVQEYLDQLDPEGPPLSLEDEEEIAKLNCKCEYCVEAEKAALAREDEYVGNLDGAFWADAEPDDGIQF